MKFWSGIAARGRQMVGGTWPFDQERGYTQWQYTGRWYQGWTEQIAYYRSMGEQFVRVDEYGSDRAGRVVYSDCGAVGFDLRSPVRNVEAYGLSGDVFHVGPGVVMRWWVPWRWVVVDVSEVWLSYAGMLYTVGRGFYMRRLGVAKPKIVEPVTQRSGGAFCEELLWDGQWENWAHVSG
jgi:hypothetical protein